MCRATVVVGRRFRLPGPNMPKYRRRLPHFHPNNAYLFLTWRPWGSLPAKVDFTVYPTPGHAFMAHDRALDGRASGPLWLRDSQIADLVAQAILIGDGERHFYQLFALGGNAEPRTFADPPSGPNPWVDEMVERIDGQNANRILGRTGQPFWQDESYDHYLRRSTQVERTVAYIEGSPVNAGLVCSTERWRWSSAGWQAKPPAPPNLPTYLSKM